MQSPDVPSPQEQHNAVSNHLKTARFFLSGQQVERAADSARKALAIEPNCDEAHAILSICASHRGDKIEARREADSALSLAPNDEYNLYASVLAAQMAGDWGRAEADARHGIAVKPEYSLLHSKLGQILSAQNRLEEARLSFAEAIRLEPAEPLHHLLMARLLFFLEEWEGCDRHLAESLRLEPENAEAQKWLGLRQIKGHQLQAALQTLRGSLSLDPNDVSIQQLYRYLETLQKPFLHLYVIAEYERSSVSGEANQPWSGIGAAAILCGCLAIIVRFRDGTSPLVIGGIYLLFCLFTLLEIYLFVASEIVARVSPNANDKPTFSTRAKMVIIALLYAVMHYLYWWLPTAF